MRQEYIIQLLRTGSEHSQSVLLGIELVSFVSASTGHAQCNLKSWLIKDWIFRHANKQIFFTYAWIGVVINVIKSELCETKSIEITWNQNWSKASLLVTFQYPFDALVLKESLVICILIILFIFLWWLWNILIWDNRRSMYLQGPDNKSDL